MPKRLGRVLRRLAIGSAAAIAAAGANWINPDLAPLPLHGAPPAHTAPSARAPLYVSSWGFSQSPAGAMPLQGPVSGGPVYLWLDLRGRESAVAALRASGGLPIEVHWTPPADAAPSAPPLTTELTVGRPGLAARLAGEVARTGSFLWHSWAEKTTLSPGRWTVSLTYPDGRPLPCAPTNEPCRFTLNVG